MKHPLRKRTPLAAAEAWVRYSQRTSLDYDKCARKVKLKRLPGGIRDGRWTRFYEQDAYRFKTMDGVSIFVVKSVQDQRWIGLGPDEVVQYVASKDRRH